MAHHALAGCLMTAVVEWEGFAFRIFETDDQITSQMHRLIQKSGIAEVWMKVTLEDGTVFEINGQTTKGES